MNNEHDSRLYPTLFLFHRAKDFFPRNEFAARRRAGVSQTVAAPEAFSASPFRIWFALGAFISFGDRPIWRSVLRWRRCRRFCPRRRASSCPAPSYILAAFSRRSGTERWNGATRRSSAFFCSSAATAASFGRRNSSRRASPPAGRDRAAVDDSDRCRSPRRSTAKRAELSGILVGFCGAAAADRLDRGSRDFAAIFTARSPSWSHRSFGPSARSTARPPPPGIAAGDHRHRDARRRRGQIFVALHLR